MDAIVAYGAIVTKDVESWIVIGGIPGKVIGYKEQKDNYLDIMRQMILNI